MASINQSMRSPRNRPLFAILIILILAWFFSGPNGIITRTFLPDDEGGGGGGDPPASDHGGAGPGGKDGTIQQSQQQFIAVPPPPNSANGAGAAAGGEVGQGDEARSEPAHVVTQHINGGYDEGAGNAGGGGGGGAGAGDAAAQPAEQQVATGGIPIIEKLGDDDRIPDEPEQPPEPRLECRASVMEFVINASDRKDECEGLKRAFDAACTDLDRAEKIFSASTDTVLRPSKVEAGQIEVVDRGEAEPELVAEEEAAAAAAAAAEAAKGGNEDLPPDAIGVAAAAEKEEEERGVNQDQVETMPEELVVGHQQQVQAEAAVAAASAAASAVSQTDARPEQPPQQEQGQVETKQQQQGGEGQKQQQPSAATGSNRSGLASAVPTHHWFSWMGGIVDEHLRTKATVVEKERAGEGSSDAVLLVPDDEALARYNARPSTAGSDEGPVTEEEEENKESSMPASVSTSADATAEPGRPHHTKGGGGGALAGEGDEGAEGPSGERQRQLASPALPSGQAHLDNMMLSDTMLLQEGTIGMVGGNQQQLNHPNPQWDQNSNRIPWGGANKNKKKKGNRGGGQRQQSQQPGWSQNAAQSILDSPASIEARSCCASILNVFHEHCDQNEELEYTDRRLFVIVSVIVLCGIVKSVIRHFKMYWLPEAAGCILVGVVLGSILESIPNIKFSFDGSLFLRVMLPPIVFDAALRIDKRSLVRYVFPIMMYAFAGTLLSAALVAVMVYSGTNGVMSPPTGTHRIPAVESFVFGALISSIDPIAILSVLQSIGMTNTDAIYVLIFGESLFNDGIAIVLYETLVEFLDDSAVVEASEVGRAAVHFLFVLSGSAIIGILSGACCTLFYAALRGCQTPMVEVLMFVCWALIPYYICDGVAWSGIVAIVAAGIVMDLFVIGQNVPESGGGEESSTATATMQESNHGGAVAAAMVAPPSSQSLRQIFSRKGHLSDVARTHVHFVSEINATLMETAIFAYLGIFLLSSRYKWSYYLTFLAILSCIASRAIMIPVLSYLINWGNGFRGSVLKRARCGKKRDDIEQESSSSEPAQPVSSIDKRMQIVLWFGGLRGAMSFALVENIPLYDAATGHGSKLKPELKAMTSASIIFTVFLCGGTTFYLLQRLGMSLRKEADMVEMSPLVALPTPNKRKTSSGHPIEDVENGSSPSFHDENGYFGSTSREGSARHRHMC